VIDIIQALESYGLNVKVFDPVASMDIAKKEYAVALTSLNEVLNIGAIIAVVPHGEILNLDLNQLMSKSKEGAPFMDVKSAFGRKALEDAGLSVWRL